MSKFLDGVLRHSVFRELAPSASFPEPFTSPERFQYTMTHERQHSSSPATNALGRREILRLAAMGVGGVGLASLLSGYAAQAPAAARHVTGTKDKIKAHWVYVGPPDDNGWTQEHERARQAVVAALGDRIDAGFTPNVGFDASTTQLFQQLVDDGNDIIFTTTEYAALLSQVADANPQVKFVETNGHHFTENTFPFYMAHEISAYLLGVAAGALTENGRIGYIGAFPTPSTYNDVNGLLLGARSVNPAATVDSVLINAFLDPQKTAQAATALIDNGVEFLFGVVNEPTYMQMAEKAGVWTGYWNLSFPQAAPTRYVSNYDLSALGPFYTEQCQAVLDGTWKAPTEIVLLPTPLGPFGPTVPEDVQKTVNDAAAEIAAGTRHVYSGPLKDNKGAEVLAAGKTLTSVDAYSVTFAVEGVNGI